MMEFDCVECGRHIIDVSGIVIEPLLCAHCLWLPGWFNDPVVVQLFDPDNDRKVPEHEKI
jgi:hypothetical protein